MKWKERQRKRQREMTNWSKKSLSVKYVERAEFFNPQGTPPEGWQPLIATIGGEVDAEF
jgi:hypothetical protein